MGCQTVAGAVCSCPFGAAPSVLSVLPTNMVMAPTPAANIMDNKPFLNILPFGTCMSLANPMVAAATAAALGVLTPMPCIPATAAPWIVGVPTILLGNMPTLSNDSKLLCNWGGMISISFAGQVQVMV
ncbi:DUF4280 domain-containing protein [Insolitispirillum peregrinum]|uniref:DUF4280 domain-containing protein n=1 Tax=Insolitispirillum peregrinum TaxID=80876 RepID=A0A1N7JH34_9PROT|nr:DUF4280 domain-containing protein [Insolitispirillum peregrinum]SIS48536.1 protein of unknown function [Insolitispirillum peregrinum]